MAVFSFLRLKCGAQWMDVLSADFLKQFPYIAVMVGLFIWFWRSMQNERDKCDQRSDKRDERFTEVIERNTRAINDLDRTISQTQFTQNDRRSS